MTGFGATQYRFNRRKCYFTNPSQVLGHFILLVFKLFVIWQHLPFTSSANTKMFAEGVNAIIRIAMKMSNPGFGPVFLIFSKSQVNNIPGNSTLNKNYFTFYFRQGLSFSGIILYEYILQDDIFFSH